MTDFLNKLRWPYRDDTVFSLLSFIVFIVPLAFSFFTNENFETIKLVLWLIFFGLTLLLWLRRKSRRSEQRLNVEVSGAAAVLLVLLVGWALLSALFAKDLPYALLGFPYRFTNGFLFLLLWSVTVLVLVDVVDAPKWHFLIKILCVDAMLVAIKSLLEAVGLTLYLGPSAGSFIRSAPSFLGNPNYSAMFMACLLPFFAVFIRQAKGVYGRLWWSVGAFAELFALTVLASRGALLALGAGIFAAFVLLLLSRSFVKAAVFKWVVAAAALLVLAACVVQLSRPGAFHWTLADNNVNFRLQVWRQSWQYGISRHLLMGVGVGNFALFQERLPRLPAMGVFDDPHNLWIFLAATGGIPLLLFFAGFAGLAWWQGFKAWQQQGGPMICAALSALVIFAVAAAFTPVPIPLFLVLAVVIAGLLPRSNVTLKLPLIVVWPSAAVAIAFIILGITLALGETVLHFGYDDYTNGDYAQAERLLSFSKSVEPFSNLPAIFYLQAQAQDGHDFAMVASKIASFSQAIHPLQANTHVQASDAYFILYVRSRDSRYLDASMNELKQSLDIDPTYAERWGELGFYAYLENNLNQALEFEQRSLALKPDLLPSLMTEAKIYQVQHNPDKLLAVLERAHAAYPDDQNIKVLWLTARQTRNTDQVPLNFIFNPQ